MQIYADNAATTKPSKAAVRAMLSCLEQNYGNPSSLHHIGQAAAEALLQARQDIAGCLGCTAREIYFTSGGSEATIRHCGLPPMPVPGPVRSTSFPPRSSTTPFSTP